VKGGAGFHKITSEVVPLGMFRREPNRLVFGYREVIVTMKRIQFIYVPVLDPFPAWEWRAEWYDQSQ